MLANATRRLAEQVITHIELRTENLQSRLAAHPILVTALAPHIGYELATEIGKYALSHRLPILDAALEKTDLGEEQLRVLLDPARLTGPDATG